MTTLTRANPLDNRSAVEFNIPAARFSRAAPARKFWIKEFLTLSSLLPIALITGLYASYNLSVKLSSDHVPENVTRTVLATICVPVAALMAELLYHFPDRAGR